MKSHRYSWEILAGFLTGDTVLTHYQLKASAVTAT